VADFEANWPELRRRLVVGRIEENRQRVARYRQILWIGFSSHAATFWWVPSTSSPFLNPAPALTSATR
jgi:hypothetical protein